MRRGPKLTQRFFNRRRALGQTAVQQPEPSPKHLVSSSEASYQHLVTRNADATGPDGWQPAQHVSQPPQLISRGLTEHRGREAGQNAAHAQLNG
jgi:hypothetical protein